MNMCNRPATSQKIVVENPRLFPQATSGKRSMLLSYKWMWSPRFFFPLYHKLSGRKSESLRLLTCQEMLHVPAGGVIIDGHSLEQGLILNLVSIWLVLLKKLLKKNLWTLNYFCIGGKDWAISGFSSSQFPKSWCHLLSESVPREWLWHTSDTQMFSMCAAVPNHSP